MDYMQVCQADTRNKVKIVFYIVPYADILPHA